MRITRHSPLIIWDVVDGQTTLCHTRTGRFFELSGAGALIWTACDGNSVEFIVERLADTYGREHRDQLAADVNTFLSALEKTGLVEVDDSL